MVELKLVVLAGAKEGTQIPLKKDKFVIGRSRECTLRAGSEAISRRHCAIQRSDGAWAVRDLGSRNGTYLNDQRVESPTPLAVGDELRVGPLKFRVDEYVKSSGGKSSKGGAKSDKSTKTDSSHDVKRSKQPPVKDVADALAREASKSDSSATEDDISRWLLGTMEPSAAEMLRETQTLSMEDTTTISRSVGPERKPTTSDDEASAELDSSAPAPAPVQTAAVAKADNAGSGGWNFLRLGKNRAEKKKPGKLPKRPEQASKDSREAAADILREMTRRR